MFFIFFFVVFSLHYNVDDFHVGKFSLSSKANGGCKFYVHFEMCFTNVNDVTRVLFSLHWNTFSFMINMRTVHIFHAFVFLSLDFHIQIDVFSSSSHRLGWLSYMIFSHTLFAAAIAKRNWNESSVWVKIEWGSIELNTAHILYVHCTHIWVKWYIATNNRYLFYA